MTNEQILQQSESLTPYVIECRRIIHQFAEIAGEEVKTSAFIRGELEALGLAVETIAGTALIATLETGRLGPCIALRADIDALPLEEFPNNLAGPRVCVSDNPKTCHACGHDAHSAMLLGAVKALMACKDSLCGTLIFIFEAGEECGYSVSKILDTLSHRRIDTCWAIHVYAGMESGKICLDAGPRMAGAAGVDITVHGKGGHGSRPDQSCNPVFCAASILVNTATAFANQITAGETVTLGVTTLHGGETGNVIPETATIGGSMRFFNMEEGKKAVQIFKTVAEHTAAMNKCSVEFGSQFEVLAGSVVNDSYYSALAQSAIKEVLPDNAVIHTDPWYATESFSRYTEIYPCVFAHLGINNPAYGSGAAHHNGFFDVDESVLPLGLKATLKYVAQAIENK